MAFTSHRLSIIQPPGAEPVTLEDVKTHLRIDHDQDDTFVAGLIAAARQICEAHTRRALITRTYALFLDVWPRDTRTLSLPNPPLIDVTLINTYDTNNVGTVFDDSRYFVDTSGMTGRVVMTDTAPSASRDVNGIEIRYRAGYGATPAAIPPALRQGLRQLIAHLYENRGDTSTQALYASGAASLFQPFRVTSLS